MYAVSNTCICKLLSQVFIVMLIRLETLGTNTPIPIFTMRINVLTNVSDYGFFFCSTEFCFILNAITNL